MSTLPSSKLRSEVSFLLLLGLVFHSIYILSVFDCYFTSPVVHGMQYFSTERPQADRLVLIVGDGLRADLLFNLNPFPFVPSSPEIVAPFLRSVVETRGAFGISHTRVPTESRPGHVALIAGMYEDVSAVTKGWKTNPVDFDSVFNQSEITFSFGSPDILPMFAKGATPGRVLTWSYDEHEEDFTKDATALDTWVLDRLTELFHNATYDSKLDAQLRSPGTVFFLHLLGLDTTGHAYRPHSEEYMKNIIHVDSIVQQTEALFKSFYKADETRTAYIFTADHGMSYRGNHGDGDPDNTRTPLILWGSGIRDPVYSSNETPSFAWRVPVEPLDVSQADISSLMAALLGRPFPVNSVGVLPDIYSSERLGFLSDKDASIAASAVNAKVILEHYRFKHNFKASRTLAYKPFNKLHKGLQPNEPPGGARISKIETLISKMSYNEARREIASLIESTLEGLRYLETYDRTLIRIIVTTGYIGWAVYNAFLILPNFQGLEFLHDVKPSTTSLWIIRIIFMGIFALMSIFFVMHQSPMTYYGYIAFPLFFWSEILIRAQAYSHKIQKDKIRFERFSTSLVIKGMITVMALLAMVMGYTHRQVWSMGFIILPLLVIPKGGEKSAHAQAWTTWLSWFISCVVTAIFPLLSVEKTEALEPIFLGGLLMIFTSLCSMWILNRYTWSYIFQTSLILLTLFITSSSVRSLQSKQGLPFINQFLGWLCFLISPAIPYISQDKDSKSDTAFSRLLSLFLSICPCFIILSVSVEGLFFVSFCITLVGWLRVETERAYSNGKRNTGPRSLQIDDIRIALYFLFFVQVVFFGTGNVASMSSFYLEPVYRLTPVFNPYLMASLLIFKNVSPYIILAAAFANITSRLSLPPFSLFLIAMSLTDGMTLAFFYNVTDTGSWLEIGQSISFFCITSLLLVWSAGICVLGEWLMRDVSTEARRDVKEKKKQ